MATGLKLPLAVIIEAVDKLTAPTRKMQRQLQQTFAPLSQLKGSVAAFGEAAGFPAAGQALGRFKDKVTAIGASVLALGRKIVVLGIAGAAAIVGLEESFAHAGESIRRSSLKLGIGTSALQELRFAADQYGVEQDALESGLMRMSKGIGEAARGQGTLQVAFQRLNIPLRDADGHLRKLDDLLPEVADKLNELRDDGRRTALTMQIFGRGGAALTPMLRHGGEMIAFMRHQAQLLGGVMSEESVEAAEKFTQAQKRTEFALRGLRDTAAAELAPALTKLADQLTAWLSDPENKRALREFVHDLGDKLPGAVKDAKEAIIQIAYVMKPFVEIVKALGDRFGYGTLAIVVFAGWVAFTLAEAILPLLAALAALAPVIAAVAAALGGFGPLIAVVVAVIIGLIARIAEFASIAWLVIRNWTAVKTFFVDLFEFHKRGWEAMVKFTEESVGKITNLLPDWLTGRSSKVSVNAGAPVGIGAGSGSGAAPSRASVLVRFENAPKGTRMVPQGNGGVDLDTSMGYSMVGFGG